MKKINVSNTEFNLFPGPDNKPGHYLNWYVYRSDAIRKELAKFWGNERSLAKVNKQTMANANQDQMIHKRINVLFRNMENDGPVRNEFAYYKYDKKKDLYHCHVSDGKNSIVVMWEADAENKIINIVRLGPHENFDFSRPHKKSKSIPKCIEIRDQDERWKKLKEEEKAKSKEGAKPLTFSKESFSRESITQEQFLQKDAIKKQKNKGIKQKNKDGRKVRI